jgi:hypothetical protein
LGVYEKHLDIKHMHVIIIVHCLIVEVIITTVIFI